MNQRMAEKQEKVVAQVDVQTADDDDEPDEWCVSWFPESS